MITCAPFDEIAKLRLPQAEHLREVQRVAVIEAEHRVFAQERIVDAEARLLRREMLQRDVPLAGLLVVEHRVALREGAAARVLAGEPDRHALDQQRAPGDRLGVRPIERPAALRQTWMRFSRKNFRSRGTR